jgi:hypothetical protein
VTTTERATAQQVGDTQASVEDATEVQPQAAGPKTKAIPPILFSGTEVVAALKAWHAEEYKQAATQPYDLGKYLLGVSSGTVTVTCALTTLLRDRIAVGWWAGIGIGVTLQVAAAMVALLLVIPRSARVDAERDIYAHYMARIRRAASLGWSWALIWTTSTIVVIVTLTVGRK